MQVPVLLPTLLAILDDPSAAVSVQGVWALHHVATEALSAGEERGGHRQQRQWQQEGSEGAGAMGAMAAREEQGSRGNRGNGSGQERRLGAGGAEQSMQLGCW